MPHFLSKRGNKNPSTASSAEQPLSSDLKALSSCACIDTASFTRLSNDMVGIILKDSDDEDNREADDADIEYKPPHVKVRPHYEPSHFHFKKVVP